MEHAGDGDAARSTEPAPEHESRFGRWRRTRVSKWDRPPPPHDWRYFVGGLGKVLIVTGLLMFGFVAYQLWGTGIETARAQNKLENQFEQLVDTAITLAPDGTPPPSTSAMSVPGTADDPIDSAPPSSAPSTSVITAGEAPPAVEQDIPPIERGQAIAKLEIPRIGKDGGDALYVVAGGQPDRPQEGPRPLPRHAVAGPARQRRHRRAPDNVSASRSATSTSSSRATRSSSRCSPASASSTRWPRPRSSRPTTTTSSPPAIRRSPS